jgi:hypothetical protein
MNSSSAAIGRKFATGRGKSVLYVFQGTLGSLTNFSAPQKTLTRPYSCVGLVFVNFTFKPIWVSHLHVEFPPSWSIFPAEQFVSAASPEGIDITMQLLAQR